MRLTLKSRKIPFESKQKVNTDIWLEFRGVLNFECKNLHLAHELNSDQSVS